MRLAKKTALVVGGGGAIGSAIALRFAAEGAGVAVADLDGERAERTAAAIRTAGGEALALVADASRVDECERVVGRVLERFGGLDCLVDAAGVAARGPIEGLTDETWEALIGTDLKSCFASVRPAIAHMSRRGGRVLTIAGRAALGSANEAAHAAVKAAVIGFTRALALEVGRLGITVNALSPAYIDTPGLRALDPAAVDRARRATAVRRVGRPEDVAAAAAFLASDEAGFITGQVLSVCGGSSIGLSPF